MLINKYFANKCYFLSYSRDVCKDVLYPKDNITNDNIKNKAKFEYIMIRINNVGYWKIFFKQKSNISSNIKAVVPSKGFKKCFFNNESIW